MPRTLKKDILRLIRATKGRFFSLTAIVTIGVAFFVGVSSSSTIMADNVDTYADRVRLKDITIYSDYGFDEEDIKAISGLEEVAYAEGSKFVDVNAAAGSTSIITRIHSYDPDSQINLFDLVEGRLPQKKNEVLSEGGTDMEPGYPVGTVLRISRPENDLDDWLDVDTVTVVGLIDTPLYLNMTKENSTLANQYIQTYLYIPEEAFVIDYDVEVNVLTKEGVSYESFYDAYEKYCSRVKEEIKDFGTTQVMHRHDEVLEEAYKELNDGWREYYDGKKEFDEEIADAEQEIADAKQEIADGWQELDDGIQKLKDAQKELDDSETDGYQQIADARAEIEKGREKLKEGESEYYEKEAEYLALKDEIDNGIKQIKEGIKQLQQAKEGLDQIDAGIAQINEAREKLTTAKEGIAMIDAGIAKIDESVTQLETAAAGLAQLDAAIAQMDGIPGMEAQKAALEAQRDAVRAQLTEQGIDPDHISETVEALKQQRAGLAEQREGVIASLQEQGIAYESIDQTIAGLDAQKTALENTRAGVVAQLKEQGIEADQIDEQIASLQAQITELNNNKRMIDEGLAEGKAQLDDAHDTLDKAYMATINAAAELAEEVEKAQKEINDGWNEIDENRQKLKDAEKDLEDAEKELEDARKDGLQELADAKEELDKAQQDIDDLEDGSWTVLDRSQHYASKTYKNTVEQMRAIGAVFPMFFFMVAALVCLTTMTRMIDEQRSQLGIMRALGYSRLQCSMKYLTYAGMATALGTVLGTVLGLAIFPYIIYTAWKMMYILPPMKLFMPWRLIVMSAVGFLAVMLATTWYVCRNDMNDVPSQLLRPKSPKLGKTALIERIGPLWNRLSFSWKITMRNLFRYKQRLIMTVIGVAGCTALLITGFGISDSINGMVDIQFDELQLFEGQVHAEGLKPSEMNVLKNDLLKQEDVSSAVIAGSYSAIAVNGHDTLEETVNVQVFEKPEMIQSCYNLRTRVGHEPIIPDDDGVIINEKLAENLGLKAGDSIIVESKTGIRKEVRIAAVTEMYIQHYMFMTQAYYSKVFGSTISMDTLMVDIDGDVEVSRAFQKRIVKDDRVSGVQFYDTILENFKSMVNSLDLIVWALIISSMSLAFVVLGNLTNINISERQREIATLKVLGFRKREVQNYIFKENNVLTGLGALAGIPIGQVLHHFIMRQVEMDYVMFGRTVDPSSNVISFFMTVLFGMLVNFFMRRRLQSIEMVESLKSVE